MARKPSTTDDAHYEIVVEDPKTGLHRRDGLPYKGIRLARKERDRLIKSGASAHVLPYRPIDERADMRTAVA